jgi:hypothetical protein
LPVRRSGEARQPGGELAMLRCSESDEREKRERRRGGARRGVGEGDERERRGRGESLLGRRRFRKVIGSHTSRSPNGVAYRLD